MVRLFRFIDPTVIGRAAKNQIKSSLKTQLARLRSTNLLASLFLPFGDVTIPPEILAMLAVVLVVLSLGLLLYRRYMQTQIGMLMQSADHLALALQLLDKNGRVLYENEAARRITRLAWGPEEGKSMLEMVDRFVIGDDFKQIFNNLRNQSRHASRDHAAQGGSVDVALRITGDDERWWRVVAMPLPRYPSFVFWSVEDISEKRQLEALAMQERRHFAALVQNAPIGFYVVDATGQLLFMNATLASWLGLSPDTWREQEVRITDLVVEPAIDMTRPYSMFPQGQDSGEVTFRRDGERFLRGFVRQELSPAAPGEASMMRAVVYDLGREHALRTALARSEQRFHNVFEDSPIGIVSVARDGAIMDCNPAFRKMVAAAGHCGGILLQDLVQEGDRPVLLSYLQHISDGQATSPPVVRWQGQETVATVYAVRQDGDPSSDSAVAICHFIDVTEQKQLEARFVQSQKMQAIGQLAGGVAHDFNNLLTAMIGFCDLLLQRHRAGDPSFSDIMQIKQNANRAANLVRQLLAFSRQQTLQPRILNITDILAELTHLLRRLIGETIELNMIHGRELPLVKVDQGQLEQVIVNLVVNARDAMPQGGVLEITTSTLTFGKPETRKGETIPAGTYAVIEVKDNGTGIPKDVIDRIFEPFFSTKEVGAGTGLGLATVYGIVKQTDGFIFVESTLGKGTVFTILLPQHIAEPNMAPVKDGAIESGLPNDLTGQGTILLVEDEDAVRIFSARALRNKGYRVIEARNGEIAIDQFAAIKDEVDLLISDVVMPRIDGPTLLKEIRSLRPDLKVIFISGYAEDSIRRQLVIDSRTQFLSKPFTLKQLASKVKDMLSATEKV